MANVPKPGSAGTKAVATPKKLAHHSKINGKLLAKQTPSKDTISTGKTTGLSARAQTRRREAKAKKAQDKHEKDLVALRARFVRIDPSLHPANAFVTLHIPSSKLQSLGLPAAKQYYTVRTGWTDCRQAVKQPEFSSVAGLVDAGTVAASFTQIEYQEQSVATNKTRTIDHSSPNAVSIQQHEITACYQALTQFGVQPISQLSLLTAPYNEWNAANSYTHPSNLLSLSTADSLDAQISSTLNEGYQKTPSHLAPRDRKSLIIKLTIPEGYHLTPDMAPVRDPNNVHGAIKDVVQNLFDLQTQVHGFVPETQPLLVDKMTELARSLAQVQSLTSPTKSPGNPIHQVRIAPEIIDYVDDGRNPDIFTRDFVELVNRGNAVINGKQQAFRDFSSIFADALKDGIDGVSEEVDQVMKNANVDEHKQPQKDARENGIARP